jgi:imidazolonepropionase-like amidohydrolase
MKAPVSERFSLKDGAASWKNKAEQGERKVQGPAMYVSMYGAPVEGALLIQAALRNGGTLDLLPEGQATVAKVLERTALAGGKSQHLTLYAVTGLDFSPIYLWLDKKGDYFSQADSWLSIVRKGWEASVPALIEAQQQAKGQRAREQAARLAHHPAGALVIRGARVFDAEAAQMVDADVILQGNRILSVGKVEAPAGAEIIDGSGKTVIPGLWDMHAHVSDNDGLLNLAAGVTSVRDLANDNDDLLARKKRIEEGTEIGTRIVLAGFMDGPGPFQGPTKVLVATEKQARDWVDRYAALGYVQIKMYSSIKPELVPAIVDEAHKKGLRVSGHIPSGMSASECVQLGFDEIQHANFLLLNFMPDVKETRTPARFLEPAKRAADLDLKSKEVQDFIQLLKDRHTTLDPTLSVMEKMFLSRAGTMAPGMAPIADRLPVQVRRQFMAGDLPDPGELDGRYKQSWQKTLELVKALYDAGVPIEAGTDDLAGFALHRELELEVLAGIPPPQALKLATLGAARIMKKDGELGSVAAGKLADLVLIDGDPTASISAVRNAALVVKDGVVYRPAELYQELGVRPR